jgi:hypothetical protein
MNWGQVMAHTAITCPQFEVDQALGSVIVA